MSRSMRTYRRCIKRILFMVLIFILATGFFFAQTGEKQPDQSAIEITHVGNSGVILSAPGQKVAIDAFFTGFKGYYEIPEKTRKLMTKASAPFHDMDLVLCTHGHGDHLDPQLLGKFLKKDKKALCLSTSEVSDDMAASVYGYDKFKERLKGVSLKKGESKKLELNGIPLEVIRLNHGKMMMQHFGFILDLAGKKIFHMGDSYGPPEEVTTELKAYGFPGRKVDIAMIPYFYLQKDKYVKMVREIIKPQGIIAVHLEVRGRGQDKESIIAKIKAQFPDIIIFTQHLEIVTIQ